MCYILAGVTSNHLSKKIHVDNLLKIDLSLIILSNVFLLVVGYQFKLSAIFIQTVKSFTYAGWGFIFGNATAQIVSSITWKVGITSAMMIALEMLFSSVIVYVLGFFFDGTTMPFSFCMIYCNNWFFMP